MKLHVFIVVLLVFCTVFLFSAVYAEESSEKQDLQQKIQEYENKLGELKEQKNTLASQIEYMDTQIYITGLRVQETNEKIEKTEYEIETLDKWIANLDKSLDTLSKTLLGRIIAGYKTRQVSVIDIVFDSGSASELINKFKYYEIARETNKRVLMDVQESKLNYEEQKTLREKKKKDLAELEKNLKVQQIQLASQQDAKKALLTATQNDEKVYQNLLAQAKAEYAAIQGIISGAGTETLISEVKAGDTIASVIPGASCNSSGGHLHFIVQQNGSVTNPFNYLKSVDYQNCSGSSCGSSDGDPFNPSGSWDWPLNPIIKMSQGYGQTWAVRNTWVGNIYSSHNGIDITGSSNDVKAVADGTLYRGSYAVGCALPYVKLVHKENGIETFYLHVYSN